MANIKLTANEKAFVEAMERASGAVGKLNAEMSVKLARSFREADFIANTFAKGLGRLQRETEEAAKKAAQMREAYVQSFRDMGDKMQSVGQNMSTYITLPLTLLAGASLKAYGELDSLKKGLASIEGTSANVEKRLTQLREAAKMPGLGFQEAIQGDVRLRSVGIAAETSMRILKEFGNANALTGGGKEKLSEIINQISQMSAKGKVLGQDLKPIIEAAPSVSTALKKMFGTVDSEGIQKQLTAAGKSSTDFINDLLTQLEKAPRVAGGFKNAMENLKDSLFVAAAGFGEALNKSFGLEGILNSLSDKLAQLTTWFQGLSPEIQKSILVLGGLVAIAGPLITAFGFITSTIVPMFITGIGTLFGPILAIGAVVAIVAANIIKYWDNIKNVLVNTGVWSGVSEVFKAGLSLLGDIVGVFISLFTADWEGLWVNMKNIMKRVWNGIVEVFTLPLKTIIQLQQSVFSSLGFDKMANGFGYALGVVNQLTNKIKADIPESTNNLKKLADAFAGLGGSGKTTTGGVTVNNGDALKALEKQRDILGKLNINTIVSADVKGIDKLMNPEKYTKNKSWVDEMLDAGKRLSKEMPKVLSVVGIQLEQDFKTQVKDRVQKAFADFGKIDTSAITSLPAIFANQLSFATAGLKIEQEIKGNVTDRAKLAFVEFQQSFSDGIVALKNTLTGDAMAGLGEALGNALGGGGFDLTPILSQALNTLGSFMIDFGKKLLVMAKLFEGAKKVFEKNPLLGAGLMIIGGGIIKGLANQVSIPKFAQGGMVTGQTFAIMGDNPSGKEMALPWERTSEFAKNIASYMGGGGGGMSMVEVKVRGEDLYAVLQMHKKNKGY